MNEALARAVSLPPREVRAQGAVYRVRAPAWGVWLRLLDAADAGHGRTLAADRVLRGWLRAAVRIAGEGGKDRSLARSEIDALPAALSDRLALAGVELMDAQRELLGLEAEAVADGWRLAAGDGELRLSPWTHGERNFELRRCLSLDVAGEIVLDLGAFERAAVCCCARWQSAAGEPAPVTPAEVQAWPVPLGEQASALLESLNEPAAEEAEVLEACARAGLEHPDLSAAELCLGYGWSPGEVAALPAAEARRSLAALRVLRGATPRGTAAAQAGVLDSVHDELTTILVRDG